MAESIIQDKRECFFCGRVTGLEVHHVFAGVANRKISQANGLFCFLCHDCHIGKAGAQYDKEKNLRLKQEAQRAYERYHSRAEWMELIRKNYLG